jgi:putative ABC transport system ATP-binding protein
LLQEKRRIRLTITSTPVFRARNLAKYYLVGDVTVHALRGIDLELFAGEFVVILGPSGSGKSTLLNILGGLDTPSSGTVEYVDHELSRASSVALNQFRRDHVGFVFQFYNLIPSLTALENVALITEIAKNPMHPADALNLVGLANRQHHFPSQLSGGEQQRVAIARAIAKRPDVLLCDEPTGALDVQTGITVLETLKKVNQEQGTLTAVITHNATISEMADRVLTMRDGCLVREDRNLHKKSPAELKW